MAARAALVRGAFKSSAGPRLRGAACTPPAPDPCLPVFPALAAQCPGLMSEECGRPAALAAGRTRKGAGEEGLVSGAAAYGGPPSSLGRAEHGAAGLQGFAGLGTTGSGWGESTALGVSPVGR